MYSTKWCLSFKTKPFRPVALDFINFGLNHFLTMQTFFFLWCFRCSRAPVCSFGNSFRCRWRSGTESLAQTQKRIERKTRQYCFERPLSLVFSDSYTHRKADDACFCILAMPTVNSSFLARWWVRCHCWRSLGTTNTGGSTDHYCPRVHWAVHNLRPNAFCILYIISAVSKAPWPTFAGWESAPVVPAASPPAVSFGSP